MSDTDQALHALLRLQKRLIGRGSGASCCTDVKIVKIREDFQKIKDTLAKLVAERDEARRLLKAVVDITLDNMAPDATHPKHPCDFIHRPDIAMCKVCENWTEALATIYPDDFQDEEDGK